MPGTEQKEKKRIIHICVCVCVCVYIYIYTYTTGYKGVMTRERTAERGALPLVQGEGVEEECRSTGSWRA